MHIPPERDLQQEVRRSADRDAFARLVQPELDVLLRVARTIVARPADAEDLVQDTLLRAFSGIGGFDGQHPRAWLLTIMRNTEKNRQRRRRPDLLNDPATTEQEIAHEGDGPEGAVIGPMFDAAVERALHGLPERHRRVIQLIDIDGLRYAEAAIVLDVAIGTVMSRLHRARTKIRNNIQSSGLTATRRHT